MDIGQSFQDAFTSIVNFLPNLLGFVLLLVIGFVVAKLLAAAVRKGLEALGLDRHLHESQAHEQVEKFMPGASPSNGISKVVFVLVFFFFLTSAISALGIPAVTGFMNQVLAYLPNVIAAILIFVVAALVAGAVAGAVARVMGDTPTGKVVATVVPALVMVIAMFMILNQLRIAPQIVTIAFAAVMGALALGLALAFGLGGREVAGRMLEDAYRKGQEQREQVRRDVEHGRNQAEREVDQARTDDSRATDSYATDSYVADSERRDTYPRDTYYDQQDDTRTQSF